MGMDRRFRGRFLAAFVLAGVETVLGSGVVAAPSPGFAVEIEGGSLKQYRGAEGSMHVSDTLIDATVRRVQGDEWELELVPNGVAITKVWFPWEAKAQTAVPAVDDALVYYPTLLGVVARETSLAEWDWKGADYPGLCFAPLVLVADGRDARMVAATNWPPRRVSPMYSLGRLGLRYDERIAPGVHRSYRALAVKATKSSNELPWQRALDDYKVWLRNHVVSAGIASAYPSWMRAADGWLNVELQDRVVWDVNAVEAVWDRWKSRLPWMQFWGQMSPHFDPNDPIQTGCCLSVTDVDPRYQPTLLQFARRIAREGHVGFYSRPRALGPLVTGDDSVGTPELGFLRGWLEKNRSQYGANAFYIDMLGHRYFGDPLRLARLLTTDIDPATVIEYPVDIYPTAFLVSGSLGGGWWQGGPGRTPDKLGRSLTRTTFPPLGRYLLDDRILFLGESNGDGRWWGPASEYWVERQAFLLGAKFDVMHPTEDGKPDGPEDRALSLAIKVREEANWWARDPVYLDRRGLENVPDGVDVRRYRGREGEDLLVVDNWQGRGGLSVLLEGKSVAFPSDRLAILVVPRTALSVLEVSDAGSCTAEKTVEARDIRVRACATRAPAQ
jgi:hypothetical protein